MAARSRATRVLDVVKVLIWAVIAVALVKFAFFPGSSAEEAQSLDPSGAYGQITTVVTKGSVKNTVTLTGTIEADEATQVRATLDGQVSRVLADDGAAVDEGAPLLEVRKEVPGEDTQTTDPEGNTTTQPGRPSFKSVIVRAPISGTLRMSALVGQSFAVGDTVGTVSPGTFSAVASLDAEQLYRLQDPPSTATIAVKNGPAPFECSGLTVGAPQSPQSPQGPQKEQDPSSSATPGGVRAKCAIPSDQKVFAGLKVTMDVTAGEATDVLVVPVSAVEGRYQQGTVYLPSDDGTQTKAQVELGLTDGRLIEVKSGLSEGEEILEFTPSARKEDAERGGWEPGPGGDYGNGFTGGQGAGDSEGRD